MDKKDFENLSESELRELKESIDEVLEEKKYKESYLKTCLLYTSPSPRD